MDQDDPASPCPECWDGRADAALVAGLAERAAAGSRPALAVLGAIDDPAAVTALLALVDHALPAVRAAAVLSLGWSGDASVVAAVAAALADQEERVRMAARAALAELGTLEAADRLAATLDAVAPDELPAVVDVLAWLRDPRGLPAARELLVTASPRAASRTGSETSAGRWRGSAATRTSR